MARDPRHQAVTAQGRLAEVQGDMQRRVAGLERNNIAVQVIASGPPTTSPPDGTAVLDLLNGFLWWRVNGAWVSLKVGALDSAYVTHSTTQNIPNASDTALHFDTARDNPAGMWASGNDTRLTAQRAGRYVFMAYASFQSNSTGRRIVKIRHQPTGDTLVQGAFATVTTADDTTPVAVTPPVPMNQGDYVEAIANQSSGVSLSTSRTGGTLGGIPGFGGYRIGP